MGRRAVGDAGEVAKVGIVPLLILAPELNCYDALVLLNFQPSAQPAREVSVRELERQVQARLAEAELEVHLHQPVDKCFPQLGRDLEKKQI